MKCRIWRRALLSTVGHAPTTNLADFAWWGTHAVQPWRPSHRYFGKVEIGSKNWKLPVENFRARLRSKYSENIWRNACVQVPNTWNFGNFLEKIGSFRTGLISQTASTRYFSRWSVYFEALPRTWEPDPFLDDFFLIGNDPVLYRKKFMQNRVRPPRPKRGLDTQTTYGPQTWKRRLLSLVEHTLSIFGGDPCPVRRGLEAAVKCYVRKARFFRCCWTEREKPGPCAGFNTAKG